MNNNICSFEGARPSCSVLFNNAQCNGVNFDLNQLSHSQLFKELIPSCIARVENSHLLMNIFKCLVIMLLLC